METTKTVTANSRLGVYVKQMESQDKTAIITATNKYVRAKRTCGDVRTTYAQLVNLFSQMERKYDFTVFNANSDVLALINEFAARVELGTKMITGANTYTCSFNTVAEANAWLACQNDIEIKNIQTQTTGAGHKVVKVKLEYAVTDTPVNVVYQIEENKKVRFFVKSNHKKFNHKWQEKNPNYSFVTSIKKEWGFRLIGGSVGYFRLVIEKYIVLYAFNNN